VLHELAHHVAGVGSGHCARWRSACAVVGARPDRLARLSKNSYRPPHKWIGRCPSCGVTYHRHRLSARIREWGLCGSCRTPLTWTETH
jgi:predicted SprT family Zn-dependent metalloprotease